MTNASSRNPYLPSLLLLSLVGLGLLVACARVPASRDAAFRGLFTQIDSLRALGRYEEAMGVVEHLESLSDRPRGRAWVAADAHRLRELLSRIASADPAERRDLAEADSLTPVIERVMAVDEDYVAAMNLAARQLELRRRHLGGEHPEVATSLQTLGRIANLSGEGARSEGYLKRALAIRRAALGPRHPQVAQSLQQWGGLLKNLQQFDQSEAIYHEALDILDVSCAKDDPARASVLESMGSLYRLLRRFEPSDECYSQALAIRRHHPGGQELDLVRCLTWFGYARMYAGRLDSAEGSLLEAARILRAHGLELSHEMADVDHLMAQIAWLCGDHARALTYWEAYDRCGTDAPRSRPQDFGLGRIRGIEGERIDALLREGEFEEAWREVCLHGGPVAASLLNLAAARRMWPEEGCRLDSLRTVLLVLGRQAQAIEAVRQVPSGDSAPRDPDARSEEAADSLRTFFARVDGERTLLEQRLLMRYASTPGGVPATPTEIQTRLGSDQALVGWVRGLWGQPDRLKVTVWAYVLRREGPIHWVHIATLNRREEGDAWTNRTLRVGRTVLRASQWPYRVAADPELEPAGVDAWREIFRPLLPYLVGVRDLVVVEGRSISMHVMNILPECLVDDQGIPLIQRYSFSYVPSPGAFARLETERAAHRSGGRRSIIAMADPFGPAGSLPEDADFSTVETDRTTGGNPLGPTLIDPILFRGALAGDRAAISRLPRLPDSRREATRAASDFPVSVVLMGQEATKRALDAALRKESHLDVLHLATHALVDPFQAERSLLVLSDAGGGPPNSGGPATGSLDDGRLTAEDVLLGPLHDIDLVTLSGCQTCQGSAVVGGEELGFAQAFLATGARSLLLSRWKVDDQATALLMSRFYEDLTGNYGDVRDGRAGIPMPKPRALQEAQNWLRRWRDPQGNLPFAHPVYWAGFVLEGAAN